MSGGGSGYATYTVKDFYDCQNYFKVPLAIANKQNLKGYAKIVTDYDDEKVIIKQWPPQGWRKVMKGTGRDGGVTEGLFKFEYRDGYLYAQNHAVGGKYTVGKVEENKHGVKSLITRELNYHPDGGQVVFPTKQYPFIILLAKPGDDVHLEDFKAFYCDGTFGVQILPNVWHQPVFPLDKKTSFKDKQGAVHACIGVDTVKEFGVWLEIPLNRL